MNEELKDIAKKIRATGKPRQITVRKLLASIGQERRGAHVTSQLNIMLMTHGLNCDPAFEKMHIDAPVTLSPRKGACAVEYDLDEDDGEDRNIKKKDTGHGTEEADERVATNLALESSALMRLWRTKQRKPSIKPTVIFESHDSMFSISVDKATSAWVIDLEFPFGGLKPDVMRSLKYVSLLPEKRTEKNRRLLSITYDPTDNDCVEFWPHFAEAILTEAAATQPKSGCAQSVARTLKKWKRLWPSARGLSDANLLGLFGELRFLRSLSKSLSPAIAVSSWQGAFARDHDFSIDRTAFEVKTSKGNGKKVIISNLHQLDDEGVAALYLVHVRLRPSDDKKDSLQALGDEIQSNLAKDSALLTTFTNKLGKAGWFKAPKDQRESIGFRAIGRSIYQVTTDFPRILRKDLSENFKPAVDLKSYTLKMALCPPPLNAADENELWEQLRAPIG